MKSSVYLDYNATAPLRPEVIEKMQEIFCCVGNPSSIHSFGRLARKHLEDSRKTIADAISAFPQEIIFTASGTEANNMVLNGFPDRTMLVSAIEHSSLIKSLPKSAVIIPVTQEGVVDLIAMDTLLAANQPAVVSVMLGNNETGVIQPIREISELCRKYGALFHCDVVQGLGKMPVDFGALGVDMMTLGAHKCGGPVGVGALVIKQTLPIKPFLTGGGQELGRRAGTENLAAICGFAVALEEASGLAHLRPWFDAMEAEMEAMGGVIFGKSVARSPNTTCVAMPGVSNEIQLMDFDLRGFAVSAGSACTSGKSAGSHVLLAMGVSPELATCTIRISGGWATKEEEIQQFTKAWKNMSRRLSPALLEAMAN